MDRVSRNQKTSPKGFPASKCDVGDWIFSKSWECQFSRFFVGEFFLELFANMLEFFCEDILGGFFGGKNF